MATNKFSFAALAGYGNSDAKAATNLQNAFRQDAKKFYAKAGYPSKDEIGILDEITPDLTNTTSAIPEFVVGFMKDEDRAFDLPASDDNCTPSSISIVHVPEKTKEGIITIDGPTKGQKYTSTTVEHDEFKVKNRRNKFKK